MEDKNAVKAFKRRRLQRLRARFDADGDEENNSSPHTGGHGNTKLPFGLCQREGIEVKSGWTPTDAWNALEGKGYSAKESYKELKETGTVSKKTPKAPEKPKLSDKEVKSAIKDYNARKRDIKAFKKESEAIEKELESARLERNFYERSFNGARDALKHHQEEVDLDKLMFSGESDMYKVEKEYRDKILKRMEDATKNVVEAGKKVEDAEKRLEESKKKVAEAEELHKSTREKCYEAIESSPIYQNVIDYRAAEEETRSDRQRLATIDKDLAVEKAQLAIYRAHLEKAKQRLEQVGDDEFEHMRQESVVRMYQKSVELSEEYVKDYEAMRAPYADRVSESDRKMSEAKGETKESDWKQIYGLSIERDTVQDGPYDKMNGFVADLRRHNVKYLSPTKYVNTPTEERIISKLAGGDKTRGSCVSLACAYLANKAGYDVTDFRGGSSRKFFATEWKRLSRALDGYEEKGYNDLEACRKLFDRVEDGKEYWFSTGRHAAVVRKKDGKLEYLELQSWKQNGWKELSEERLEKRFRCKRSQSYEQTNTLVEASKVTGSSEFMSMMGYINTAVDKQKKGAGGGEK